MYTDTHTHTYRHTQTDRQTERDTHTHTHTHTPAANFISLKKKKKETRLKIEYCLEILVNKQTTDQSQLYNIGLLYLLRRLLSITIFNFIFI